MVGPVDSVTVKKVRNWEDLYQMIQYTAEDLYQNDEHEFTSFVLRIISSYPPWSVSFSVFSTAIIIHLVWFRLSDFGLLVRKSIVSYTFFV